MKASFKTPIIYALLLTCSGLIIYILYLRQNEQQMDSKYLALGNMALKTDQKLTIIRDTILKRDSVYFEKTALQDKKADSLAKTSHQPTIGGSLDTVKSAIEKSLAASSGEKRIRQLQDTLFVFQQANAALKNSNDSLIIRNRNWEIYVENQNGHFRSDSELLAASPWAATIKPVQQKNRGLLGSNKYYLRFSRLDTLSKINGDFLDLSVPNDERNQFALQLRSNYNYSTNAVNAGLGFELKINRIALSVAWLVNPKYLRDYFNRSAFSSGLKYDFLRRRL